MTGSDTSSNSLFGVLQVSAAKEAGLDPTLLASANSSGGVLGKMVSPQNLAIGAAAVGLRRSGGRPLPESHRLEPVPAADHVRVGLSAIDGGVVMDGRVGAAPEGPAVAHDDAAGQAPRDISGLVAELRRIAGDEWVYTAEHQLRTYESDGLLQYTSTPAAAVLPNTSDQVQRIVRGVRARGGPVGRARRRLGALRRRAAGQGRRADRARADEADPRDRPRERARVRRAGRDQRQRVAPPSGPGSSIRPTRRRRSSARSAATSPRTRAARTASSTASRPTT